MSNAQLATDGKSITERQKFAVCQIICPCNSVGSFKTMGISVGQQRIIKC